MKRALSAITLSLVLTQTGAMATTYGMRLMDQHADAAIGEYDYALRERIRSNWLPLGEANVTDSDPDANTVIFQVPPDGRIENIQLIRTTGNLQRDFSYVDAALSTSPGAPPPFDRWFSATAPGRVTFTPPTKGELEISKNFFAVYPNLKQDSVLVRIIPHDVLIRYPGVMTASEVDAVENLRAIPTNVLSADTPSVQSNSSGTEYFRKHKTASKVGMPVVVPWASPFPIQSNKLRQFYSSWTDFFDKHKVASKSELLAEKRKILRQFSSLFWDGNRKRDAASKPHPDKESSPTS